ncbi:primosomal protein N' [Lacticaseibacillus paracasei]|uniref:primosomal protein N' n=1 Tax=Lacticaseibacillus paracasei TaxID=1597 RepID=UPI00019791A2|nr:primosomal protein N' [Lacticaseibacillus paracasei]ASU12672.1 primosomal protein N' [Lacticaseibacillus paracasei]AWR92253.1 primosomal protein N' [Lacticaseibacillus paracasei]EKP99581.1 DNA helicase [Lacticaseibacillus casei 12A]
MAIVAKVIVDVPTMQTDRPFDYLVPARLEGALQAGMRVWVQFGKGARKVSGMVVSVSDQSDYDGQLKPLLDVLDPAPVLDHELLKLSKWLAQTTYSFWIACMQTMLPTMLKIDAVKVAEPVKLSADEQQKYFGTADSLAIGSLNAEQQVAVMKLAQAGKVAISYLKKDRARVKKIFYLIPQLSPEQAAAEREHVRKNAAKQLKLLTLIGEWAANNQHPALMTVEHQYGLTKPVINQAVEKGWLKLEGHETYRDPYPELQHQPLTKPLPLTPEQQTIVTQINAAVAERDPKTFLLEGVTGSGKTEVYLQVIARVLAAGQTALMLVPEIALTPQMVNRVKGRFGTHVAVMHSGLSDGEKYDEWRRIARGEAQVVVGARSAAFAPLKNIGVFIMDEEHETSYKQDSAPRYYARDVLLKRAQIHHAPVVLGSATPSLESRARAEKGVYTLLRLPHRINDQPLPPVHIVDMREAFAHGAQEDFSGPLLDALRIRLQRQEQSVLLLNRRGYSSFVMCRDCGYVAKCPNCDISLTLHMDTHTLKCHYCGHEEPIPHRCPNCGSDKIRYYGTGTQKVEAQLQQLLPDARILRMDVDTTRRKGGHARILDAFGDHQADILLGTQMIAKGLDFPDVTLVGVINADTALGLPDFRASEKTFQLLTQVSGRAGRADKPGEVFVQTFNPDHYAIQYAKRQDYEGFFRQEMAIRHRGNYPPYFYSTKIAVSHVDETQAAKAIFSLAKELREHLSDQVIMLGPTPGPIARLKNRYIYQIVLKYKHEPALAATLQHILEETQQSSRHGFLVAIDPEPLAFV